MDIWCHNPTHTGWRGYFWDCAECEAERKKRDAEESMSAIACHSGHPQGMLQPHHRAALTLAVWRNWQTQWTQNLQRLRVKTGLPGDVAVPW